MSGEFTLVWDTDDPEVLSDRLAFADKRAVELMFAAELQGEASDNTDAGVRDLMRESCFWAGVADAIEEELAYGAMGRELDAYYV